MTVNRRKKASRMRGTHTHGWGAKKKHRGGGHRGGRGNCATGKRADAKKPSIWKEYATYFGKHGFVHKNAVKINAVNLRYLENHIDVLVECKKASFNNGTYTINLTEIGYDKLLSKGAVSKKFEIIVDCATESAIAKVKKAGGSVTVSEESTPEAPKKEAEEKDEE
ncbi:MAG: uL15m family ribosomal protein [Candidatus Woesearchaeota archaeon]